MLESLEEDLRKTIICRKRILKKNQLIHLTPDKSECCLILKGYAAISKNYQNPNIYTFLGPGDVTGLSFLMGNPILQGSRIVKSITNAELLCVKRNDLEYFLALPEFNAYNHTFYNRLASHYILKSILYVQSKKYLVLQALNNLILIFKYAEVLRQNDYLILPPRFSLSHLFKYTPLASECFYKQIKALREIGVIEKSVGAYAIDLKILRKLSERMGNHFLLFNTYN